MLYTILQTLNEINASLQKLFRETISIPRILPQQQKSRKMAIIWPKFCG